MELLEADDRVQEDDDNEGDDFRVKRTRRVFQRADYAQAPWEIMLREEAVDDYTSREARRFRRRFRIPYVVFLELMAMVKANS